MRSSPLPFYSDSGPKATFLAADRGKISMEEGTTFDPDLIHGIFKGVWEKMALEQGRTEASDAADSEAGVSTTKRHRPTTANASALKLSAELLRLFVVEAVQRSASIAEVEGATKIEATHLERILPQLLLDF